MCPIKEEEVEEVIEKVEDLEALVEEEVSEEKGSVEKGSEDPVVDSGQDQEFEGVDSIEDIPKGKEKSYGI